MKISRENFNQFAANISGIVNRFGNPDKKLLEAMFNENGIEVEPPKPELLPGVSKGNWSPCCGHNSDKGGYYIHADGEAIAVVSNPYNRQLMVQSKAMFEVLNKIRLWVDGLPECDMPDDLFDEIIGVMADAGANMETDNEDTYSG